MAGETDLAHLLEPDAEPHPRPPTGNSLTGAGAPVAAGCGPLGEGVLGVGPAQLDGAFAPQVVAKETDLALELGHAVLAEPLERRVRLGYEPAHRRGHRSGLGVTLPDGDAVPG